MPQSTGTSFHLDFPVRAPGRVTVALLRHGRTEWNAQRRFLGRTDLGLDSLGLEQAARAGSALQGCFDQVYSSPLRRALETAAPIEASPRLHPGLTELDVGALDGLHGHEALERHGEILERWNADPTDVQMPGGESLRQVQRRAEGAIRDIAAAHAGQRVLVVTHQMVIAALSCLGAGRPLSAWRTYRAENTGLNLLEVVDGRITLVKHGLVAGG